MASPKYTSLLAGKRVVIIGGTSGIGFAVAEAVIEEGASVYIASSSKDKVDAAVKQLSDSSKLYNADPKRVAGTTVDLKSGSGTEESLRKLFTSLPASWNGKVDHVVHTAGDQLAVNDLTQTSYEQILAAGQVRFFSVLLTAKVAIEYFDKNGSFTITSGSVARKPRPNWAAISSYAAGLEGMTRGLALDLGSKPNGPRVNCVIPGPVKTPLWAPLPKEQLDAMFKAMEEKALTNGVPEASVVAQTYRESTCWSMLDLPPLTCPPQCSCSRNSQGLEHHRSVDRHRLGSWPRLILPCRQATLNIDCMELESGFSEKRRTRTSVSNNAKGWMRSCLCVGLCVSSRNAQEMLDGCRLKTCCRSLRRCA